MTDVYAEFGINNAVMSSSNITEHEQNMLALPTNVRDGDDEISFEEFDKDKLNEESGEESNDDAQGDDSGDEALEGEFVLLGEPDASLIEASKEVDEYAEGFQQLRAQAVKLGLPADVAATIEAEYESDNQLSEASLKALEEVGYSRGFVRSYIAGQEAVAAKYVSQIQAYAGGQEKFDQVITHLKANSPDAVEALNAAMERQDLAAIKTLINLGMQSRTKKFGKSPERTVNKRASAPKADPSGSVEGFASQRDMVKAMSDPKYQVDPVYRKSVEDKVAASSW